MSVREGPLLIALLVVAIIAVVVLTRSLSDSNERGSRNELEPRSPLPAHDPGMPDYSRGRRDGSGMAKDHTALPSNHSSDAGLGVASDALREIITGFLNEVRFD
jgi:hypothetical protein